MSDRNVVFVALILAWLAPTRCNAWSGAGHMVIAASAYRELPIKTRAKVDSILRAHPEYEQWKASFLGNAEGIELGLYVFMLASKWPDQIHAQHSHYDHPRWHFIDYPLKPPRFPVEAGPAPGDDLLFAIRRSEKELTDRSISAEARAAYLAWLIHLIGDLHQPLHCASLVNSAYPNGDHGGNDFYVMPGRKGIRLHAYWDGLLGTGHQPREVANYSRQLSKQYPRRSLSELKRSEVEEWTLETRALAVEKAYLSGKLKGGRNPDDAPPLPEGYSKAAKIVAERQAALAGFRLADEIRQCVN